MSYLMSAKDRLKQFEQKSSNSDTKKTSGSGPKKIGKLNVGGSKKEEKSELEEKKLKKVVRKKSDTKIEESKPGDSSKSGKTNGTINDKKETAKEPKTKVEDKDKKKSQESSKTNDKKAYKKEESKTIENSKPENKSEDKTKEKVTKVGESDKIEVNADNDKKETDKPKNAPGKFLKKTKKAVDTEQEAKKTAEANKKTEEETKRTSEEDKKTQAAPKLEKDKKEVNKNHVKEENPVKPGINDSKEKSKKTLTSKAEVKDVGEKKISQSEKDSSNKIVKKESETKEPEQAKPAETKETEQKKTDSKIKSESENLKKEEKLKTKAEAPNDESNKITEKKVVDKKEENKQCPKKEPVPAISNKEENKQSSAKEPVAAIGKKEELSESSKKSDSIKKQTFTDKSKAEMNKAKDEVKTMTEHKLEEENKQKENTEPKAEMNKANGSKVESKPNQDVKVSNEEKNKPKEQTKEEPKEVVNKPKDDAKKDGDASNKENSKPEEEVRKTKEAKDQKEEEQRQKAEIKVQGQESKQKEEIKKPNEDSHKPTEVTNKAKAEDKPTIDKPQQESQQPQDYNKTLEKIEVQEEKASSVTEQITKDESVELKQPEQLQQAVPNEKSNAEADLKEENLRKQIVTTSHPPEEIVLTNQTNSETKPKAEASLSKQEINQGKATEDPIGTETDNDTNKKIALNMAENIINDVKEKILRDDESKKIGDQNMVVTEEKVPDDIALAIKDEDLDLDAELQANMEIASPDEKSVALQKVSQQPDKNKETIEKVEPQVAKVAQNEIPEEEIIVPKIADKKKELPAVLPLEDSKSEQQLENKDAIAEAKEEILVQPHPKYRKPQEFKTIPEEFYDTLFYFSGMGTVVGSALSKGIYVPQRATKTALDVECIEDYEAVKDEEIKQDTHSIRTARHQAVDLSEELRKLQGLLGGLPNFVDSSASNMKIVGSIGGSSIGASPYHAFQPIGKPRKLVEPLDLSNIQGGARERKPQSVDLISQRAQAVAKTNQQLPKPEPVRAAGRREQAPPQPPVQAKPEPPVQTAPQPIVKALPQHPVQAPPQPIVQASPQPTVQAPPQPPVQFPPQPPVHAAYPAPAQSLSKRNFGVDQENMPLTNLNSLLNGMMNEPANRKNTMPSDSSFKPTGATPLAPIENQPQQGGARPYGVHTADPNMVSTSKPWQERYGTKTVEDSHKIKPFTQGGEIPGGLKPWQLSRLRGFEAKGYQFAHEVPKSGADHSDSFYHGETTIEDTPNTYSPFLVSGRSQSVDREKKVMKAHQPTNSGLFKKHFYNSQGDKMDALPYCDL